jgi:hypothetical protein
LRSSRRRGSKAWCTSSSAQRKMVEARIEKLQRVVALRAPQPQGAEPSHLRMSTRISTSAWVSRCSRRGSFTARRKINEKIEELRG